MNRPAVILVGYAMALALAVVSTATWFVAYLNDYRFAVTVNDFGEAGVELLALVAIVWPAITLGLFYAVEAARSGPTAEADA